MLILTRRTSQALMIGEDITVTVLAIHGHQVRLGVTAPENVEVHREEIYRRIHGNRKRTGGGDPSGSQTN